MAEERGGHKRRTGLLGFGLKLVVTVALLWWLADSGHLDFKRLFVFVARPEVLVWTLVAWTYGLLLGSARWRELLVSVGLRLFWSRAIALHATALFFNGIVPGNVGGDLLKNRAVLGNRAAQLLVLVFAERVLGLISLVWLGMAGLLFNLNRVLSEPRFYSVLVGLSVLFFGSLLGPWGLRLVLRRAQPFLERHALSDRSGLWVRLKKALYSLAFALDLLRRSPGAVARAFALSLVMQAGNLAYFIFLTRSLENPTASFSLIAMVLPLGVLSLIVPVSVSGLGVGHVAFEHLFQLVGLEGGADTFNVYIVGQMTPALLGSLTFLFTGQSRSLRAVSPWVDDGAERSALRYSGPGEGGSVRPPAEQPNTDEG